MKSNGIKVGKLNKRRGERILGIIFSNVLCIVCTSYFSLPPFLPAGTNKRRYRNTATYGAESGEKITISPCHGGRHRGIETSLTKLCGNHSAPFVFLAGCQRPFEMWDEVRCKSSVLQRIRSLYFVFRLSCPRRFEN